MFKIKSFLVLLIFNMLCYAQELPPVVKYDTSIYGAGNQNWMIAQDKNNFIFFANNEGLLEFNGSSWVLYPSPNETIIRSVKEIGDKIFTGCYMEFGYWNRQRDGKLKYTSLSKKIKNKILDDEQFWNIYNIDQWYIFQSLNRIYIYDSKTDSFKIITPQTNIIKSFIANNSIYFQTQNEGLFEIENGKSKLVTNNPLLLNNRIVNVFSINDGLLILTQRNGMFKLIGNELTKFSTEAESELVFNNIYCGQILSDGLFAIGTISNGIFILTPEGKVKYHITQKKGLTNNTVLSLYEDKDNNLWLGLDNGINCINLKSTVKCYFDDTGDLGTVYASVLHNGNLYIGTNQGLFYKNYFTNDNFKFVNGTKGQVWSLFVYDNVLFCGHDSGTFIIDNNSANHIFSQSGTWNFKMIPNNKNFLLQGNYYGLSVIEKVNNNWVFRNKISGFNSSARYLEINNSLNAFISHEYKGVFKVQLDKKLLNAKNFYSFTYPNKGKNSSLIKFNGTIYYAYKKGVFKFNSKTNQFQKDKLLSSVFEKDEYTSGKMIVDKSNKIWFFSKNYIHYFTISKLSSDLKQTTIPIPTTLTNSLTGFENITQISNSIYLIGTNDGYYTLNLNDLSFKNYNVSITSITVNKLNQKSFNYPINGNGSFKHDENNITFSYTVPEYNKYINADYQYLLEGFQNEWSEWSAKSTINFKNLSSGDYTFKVRARNANSNLENIAIYRFSILKPWYSTHFAVVLYLILFVVLVYFINRTYKKYFQKQRDKLIEENNRLLELKELEIEKQMMKVRNEQLSQDVDIKSKELAVSTLSLINKNELLTMINEDLKKNSEEGNRNIKSVISTISKNISEEDSWKVFKEAFDTADKDFLKKVKQAHPSLTPNDLRLCAYLRLNLSSKEIAPLLSISVRSVEIKRYRLRKKMNLNHEDGLVEYILSI